MAPPSTAALMLTSGVPRDEPTTLATPPWYDGRGNTVDCPPPPAAGEPSSAVSFQTLSGAVRAPIAFRCSWVPPTAVTSGSLDGQSIERNGNRSIALSS